MAKEAILKLSVVETRESAKNFGDFADASGNNVAREGYVTHRRAKQLKAAVGGTRNPAVEGVNDG